VVDPFTEREAGTVAFDTTTGKWHFVDRQKNLPFIGEAVPYEYMSKEDNGLTAFYISMTESKKGTTPNLSIAEVPVTIAMTNETVTSGQFFSSLGNGVICEVGCCTENWTCNEMTSASMSTGALMWRRNKKHNGLKRSCFPTTLKCTPSFS
jgi:hypothetical protein